MTNYISIIDPETRHQVAQFLHDIQPKLDHQIDLVCTELLELPGITMHDLDRQKIDNQLLGHYLRYGEWENPQEFAETCPPAIFLQK